MIQADHRSTRRQDPPVPVTVSLPRRLHGVFEERARKRGLRLSQFVEQLIEVAWSQANGLAEAAPIVVEPAPATDAEAEQLRARIASLEEQLDRRPPPDNRYWEGRWRDEAAENERLRQELDKARWAAVAPAPTEETPAPTSKPAPYASSPPARPLAPAEIRAIRGLLAVGQTTRDIQRTYGYSPAQIATARQA